MINITYKNKDWQARRIIYPMYVDDDILWHEIRELLFKWATNIYIYNQ
jgi:hypothetical protein